MERRKVLTLLVSGGSALIACVVGVPALIYAVTPAARRRQVSEWRSLGPIDQFPVGEIREGVIQPNAAAAANQTVASGVYVWRQGADEVIVFSRSCTDLGCPVSFDAGSQCFLCPCHGGIFDRNGNRMAGPPDRPLYRYKNRVEDGELQVDLTSVPPMV